MNCNITTTSCSSETDNLEAIQAIATAIFLFLFAVLRLAIIDSSGDSNRAVSVFTLPALGLVTLAVGLRLQSTRFRALGKIIIGVSLFRLSLIGADEIVPLIFYASREAPLRDDLFAWIDELLGLRWTDYARYLLGIPYLSRILGAAYAAIFVLPVFISLSMVHLNAMGRLCRFILSLTISLYPIIVIGSLLPSVGAYEHFFESAKAIPNMFGDKDSIGMALKLARSGALDEELLTGTAIVQFPSYHACAGIIFIFAAWNTALRTVTILFSILLILATPIGGSHYFIDVFAGIVVGLVSWLIANHLLDWLSRIVSKYIEGNIVYEILARPLAIPTIIEELRRR